MERGATIVEIGWDNVFGELLTADLHIEVISKNEKFIDPVHEVDVLAPRSIFGCKFVCVYLEKPPYACTSASKGGHVHVGLLVTN